MLVSKFPAVSTAAILAAHCALAQAKTRLPEAGVTASHDEAQAPTPLVASTGAKTAAPLYGLAAPGVVIAKAMLRAQSALPPDDAISCASSPSKFDISPLPRLRAALFASS